MSRYYLTNDLMFASRVLHVAERAGQPMRMLSKTDDLFAAIASQGCELVLLDLALPNLAVGETVSKLRELHPTARLIAYGPHVHEGLLREASEQGCDQVLTRGQFHSQLESLFG